jgi:rhodanese-related sulfurtransferase
MEVKEICPTTANSWLAEGAIMVDVRENDEVEELAYDVKGLIHIPLSELEERFNEVPKDKNIIMACRSGARSMRATGFLMNQGYKTVSNMQSGIIGWSEKGFPVIG